MDHSCSAWKASAFPITDIEENKSYLLNNKNKHQSSLESYVTQVSSFHINRLMLDSNNTTVQYYINSPDEIISTNITYTCITHISGNSPIVLTFLDAYKIKYKKFNNETRIVLYNPSENTHLFYKSEYYARTLSNDEVKLLYINIISNVKVETEECIESEIVSINNKIIKFECVTDYAPIYVNDMLDYCFFNDLIYIKENKFSFIDEILSSDIKFTIREIHDRSLDPIDDKTNEYISQIKGDVSSISITNRFINKYTHTSRYSKSVCDWLIHETFTRTNKLYHDIVNDDIYTNARSYILFTLLKIILPDISKQYNVNMKSHTIDVKSIFIYDGSNVSMPEIINKSFINIDIILSGVNNKYYKFIDKAEYNLKKGDSLIYCNSMLCGYNRDDTSNMIIMSIGVDIYKH